MKIVLNTTHLGVIGGGENYLMRLAMALDEISDFYVVDSWPPQFKENNGFYKSFKKYNGLFQPDVFIHCSHFHNTIPIGKRNFIVSFFPKKELRPSHLWDGCISICDYTAKFVQSYWGLDSTVIYPCIDPSYYSTGKKERKIVSIGHFFEESDGHSKNQHILIDAFKQLDGYELVLIGSLNQGDEPYVRKLRKLSENINCRIEINRDGAYVRKELESASHLWSANGYGRTDPAQCEHFGIIFLEAIASGVVPIGHKSGGFAEIDGVIGWERPEELVKFTLETQTCPRLQPQFTIESFNKEVGKWLRAIIL